MSEEAKAQSGVSVYFAFSQEDEELRDELESHLVVLKRQGLVRTWHDRRIHAGQEWAGKIDENLEQADIILLLVSPSFVASGYCWDVEIERALARHEAGEAQVIPIILRPVDWTAATFGKLQALPADGRPVTTWADRDEAFLNVASGLRAAVEERTRGRDRLRAMELRGFSVFEDARFDFCPGLNVLIGLNATGKSHAMKLAYSLLHSWARVQRFRGVGTLGELLQRKLAGVFLPEDGKLGRLVRRAQDTAEIDLRSELGSLRFRLDGDGTLTADDLRPPALASEVIFVPSRETLAMYEGFVAAYENRELSFDETYYDLCVAMSASPLRSNHLGELGGILESLEDTLGGRIRLRGNRFYVESEQEKTEAHLLAEGLRRIAVVAQLIRNGSLGKSSVLFWDEPEANLNPRLVTRVTEVLRQLAAAGFQVVLATHDYLLAHQLSLAAEYPQENSVETRFLSLYRDQPEGPVRVESAPSLAEVEHNPILEEYAAHHDRELILFQQTLEAEEEVEA